MAEFASRALVCLKTTTQVRTLENVLPQLLVYIFYVIFLMSHASIHLAALTLDILSTEFTPKDHTTEL